MRSRISHGLWCVGLVSGLALAACSSADHAAPPTLTAGPTDSVRPLPTASETPQPEEPTYGIVEQRDDLTHERVVPWSNATELSGNRLRVDFTMGSPKCTGARAVVEESTDTVDIAVLNGTLPEAPRNCTMEALLAAVVVELDEPLGDRTLRHLESVGESD
ncbi:MAG: hypothetical protein ACTMIK_02535 [Galactobacter sp.]